jgi:uncharacterized protein (TIRG00374 family)
MPPAPPVTGQVQQRSPLLWTIIGTTLGLCLLYASTRKVDLATLLTTLRFIKWNWAAGILGATVSFCAIKAWRWGTLLRFVPGLRFRDLHAGVYIGLAVNFLVSHAGEFLRSTMISRQRGIAISAVFASVIVERALDFIALLVLITLAFFLSPNPPGIVAVAAAVSGVIVIMTVTGLYLLLHSPAWLERLASTLSRALPQRMRDVARQQLERSRLGLAAIRNLRLMMLAVIVSVVQWLLVVAAIGCSSLAVGESVSLVDAVVTLILIVVGLTLPSSPMQVGTTQLAFTIGLGLGGTHATAAIAASLVYTTFLIVPEMVVGGILMLRIRSTSALPGRRGR